MIGNMIDNRFCLIFLLKMENIINVIMAKRIIDLEIVKNSPKVLMYRVNLNHGFSKQLNDRMIPIKQNRAKEFGYISVPYKRQILDKKKSPQSA